MAKCADKIAVIGDLHGKWNQLDNDFFGAGDFDLLIFVGDLGGGTLRSQTDVVRRIGQLKVPALVMPGNNDAEYLSELSAELAHQEGRAALFQGLIESDEGSIEQCGFSSHSLATKGGPVTLIGGRPCAMGGSEFSFGTQLERQFGVTGMKHSVGRMKRLVDESDTDDLIFVAHNGPFGLGGDPEAPWSRDFRLPEEMEEDAPNDWGDSDLAEVISYARSIGKKVLAVIAGHMHRHPRGGKRPLEVRVDETAYVNGAVVPRILPGEFGERHHYVKLELDLTQAKDRVRVEERWCELPLEHAAE